MHTYLNIHLSSGLKGKPTLSALLYCRDNKALHFTVGKVRRNVSSGINGEDEPRAQSAGKSALSISASHKTRLAPPSLHFEGASGTLKCRNKTTNSKWKAEFIRNSLSVMEKRTAEQSRTPLTSLQQCLQHPLGMAQELHTAGHGHSKGRWETAVLPCPSLPCPQAGLGHWGRAQQVPKSTPCHAADGRSKSSCGSITGDPFHSPADIQHSPGATGPSALISKSFLS